MLKRIETWLRRIFGTEFAPLKSDLVTLEARLCAEINKRLAVIEAGLAQQLNDLTAQAVTNFAAKIAEAQRRLDHKILETQNLLNHCRIDEEVRKADELLIHPKLKRR